MPGKPSASYSAPAILSDLTETERDLFSHLQDGYELETDSLGGDPLLRRLKDQEVIRPLSATRNTVEALQKRGLIAPAKSDDPLRMLWRLNQPRSAKKFSRTRTRIRKKP